jgi:hypothetical protein
MSAEAIAAAKPQHAIMVAGKTGRSGDRVAIGRIAERAGGPRGNQPPFESGERPRVRAAPAGFTLRRR